MNELINARDQAVQQSMTNMEFHPVLVEEDLAIAQYTKIPKAGREGLCDR